MFTNGSMDFIENLIVGSYPNGLRDKDERQRYFDNFVRMFNRYDEQDVADVVEEVISRERFLPSLATFKEALDKKAQARAESERTAIKIAEYRKPRGRVKVQEKRRVRTTHSEPVTRIRQTVMAGYYGQRHSSELSAVNPLSAERVHD